MSSPSDPNEFTQRAPVSKVTRGLPESIISFGRRWVAIKQFPSGDIAVKVVSWDPDLVSLVKNLAQAHGGRYNHGAHGLVRSTAFRLSRPPLPPPTPHLNPPSMNTGTSSPILKQADDQSRHHKRVLARLLDKLEITDDSVPSPLSTTP